MVSTIQQIFAIRVLFRDSKNDTIHTIRNSRTISRFANESGLSNYFANFLGYISRFANFFAIRKLFRNSRTIRFADYSRFANYFAIRELFAIVIVQTIYDSQTILRSIRKLFHDFRADRRQHSPTRAFRV
jgi:hypothetical protein